MAILQGRIYAGGGRFDDGWIDIDPSGRVRARGRNNPPARPVARGIVVPAPVNAHTHAGDAFLRGRLPPDLSLAEAVAPPDGFKHRMLRAADPAEVVDGIRRFAAESRNAGTLAILDFREGGSDGVKLLREGFVSSGVEAVAYARPLDPGATDLAAVASVAEGIGLSALRDVGIDRARAMREAARAANVAFAMHASEGVREPIEEVLGLAPDFLVHMCAATPDDLDCVAAAGIPIVLCPRSNARFGLAADVTSMVRSGCRLALGTDNAMLQDGDVIAEWRSAASQFPEHTEALLVAALEGGRSILLGDDANNGLDPGGRGGILVIDDTDDEASSDPLGTLLATDRKIIARY